VREVPAKLTLASLTGIRPAIATLGEAVHTIAQQAALVLVFIGGVDYAYKLRQYKKRTMMTREEVTEDMKNAEGQPMLKAKLRELQRRMSRGRMMQQVPRADVIVTNPTHLAVALRYDAATMGAPLVIAKGRDLVAQEIVRRATEHGVPIVQNIPLARALIRVELDRPVPVALYHAVAEVLAFVYRVRAPGARRSGNVQPQAGGGLER
jgi:flagellar biosynthetic protein FlhB